MFFENVGLSVHLTLLNDIENQMTQEKTLGRPILLSKTCVTKSLIMQETKDKNSPMLHSATQTWKGKIRNERESSTFIFVSYEAAKHATVSWRVTFHGDSCDTCLAKPLYNSMSLARAPTTQQSQTILFFQTKRLFQKQILPRKCSRFGSDGKAQLRYFPLFCSHFYIPFSGKVYNHQSYCYIYFYSTLCFV